MLATKVCSQKNSSLLRSREHLAAKFVARAKLEEGM